MYRAKEGEAKTQGNYASLSTLPNDDRRAFYAGKVGETRFIVVRPGLQVRTLIMLILEETAFTYSFQFYFIEKPILPLYALVIQLFEAS